MWLIYFSVTDKRSVIEEENERNLFSLTKSFIPLQIKSHVCLFLSTEWEIENFMCSWVSLSNTFRFKATKGYRQFCVSQKKKKWEQNSFFKSKLQIPRFCPFTLHDKLWTKKTLQSVSCSHIKWRDRRTIKYRFAMNILAQSITQDSCEKNENEKVLTFRFARKNSHEIMSCDVDNDLRTLRCWETRYLSCVLTPNS